jgi:hypothetical protein
MATGVEERFALDFVTTPRSTVCSKRSDESTPPRCDEHSEPSSCRSDRAVRRHASHETISEHARRYWTLWRGVPLRFPDARRELSSRLRRADVDMPHRVVRRSTR